MDLDDFLSFKSHKKTGSKRSSTNNQLDLDARPPPAKIPARDPGPTSARPSTNSSNGGERHVNSVGAAALELNGVSDEEKLRLLQSLDDDEDDMGEILDAGAVKRMLLSFEKKVLKNQEMRIKFPDMPEKFMDSEIELNDEIQKLHVIATVPEYYPALVETNAIQTLVGLLSHDNSDVAIAVIDLIQEMTDVDTVTESEEEAEQLIDGLLAEQIIALLVQNLERLDEKVKEDFDGVHNTLAIIENMCELKNTEVCEVAGDQDLLIWLLKRIRVRQYDANKLYSAEILAILLQGNSKNQQFLGEKEGIDILLQALAYYKKRDPGGTDEIEMMENLFDCLCSALMFTPNRERFLRGEGLQLMILMLKEKKMSRRSALKVLNHAMCNKEGVDNCMKFVEVYGLRSLFPAFMKTPKREIKAGASETEHEEHVCAIIVSLFRNVSGTPRERLVSKFVENDHEKIERLIELHFKCLRRVKESSDQMRRERQADAAIDSEDEYLRRLDAGLFTLQLVDYIIAELCVCPIDSVTSRIQKLLNQHGDSMETVKETLLEYAVNFGEGGNKDSSAVKERERLTALADKL